MHTPLFYVAIVWLVVLLATTVTLAVRHPDELTTLLLVDTSTLLVIAILLVYTLHEREGYYLDPALVVALLSFVETLVAARFLGRGGLFR